MDWYDGRIDRAYAPSCYEQALDRVPSHTIYSTVSRDLERGLALARLRRSACGQ